MAKPEYLNPQTENGIRQRMLDTLPTDLDKNPGSFIYDSVSPAAIEFALVAVGLQEVLRLGFTGTAASTIAGEVTDELTKRAEEHGVIRKVAVKATGTVTFTGTAGTVIPSGTRISTASTDAKPAVIFQTMAVATVAAGGSIDVAVEAVTTGIDGNAGAGTIVFLESSIAGIASLTNAVATTGGTNQEDDVALLARYLTKVKSPSAGGNKADYVNWALEVTGVGGVSVVPVRDGPGTVSVAIIDTSKKSASQTLVDTVQDYIAPPHKNTYQAETLTIGGGGVTIDSTLADDTTDSIKMTYVVGNAGIITHANLHTLLQQPGIWTARPRVKVDNAAGATNLFEFGVWNVSAAAWAKTRSGGATDAKVTLKASDIGTAFTEKVVEFYWNGTDLLEWRATRLLVDTTTIVWVDQVLYRSAFSKDTGDGKAPIGARVTVEAASTVLISASATLTIAAGYDAASVRSAVQTNLDAYLKSLAFAADNDVRFVRIGQTILDTAGVQDYTGLTVNGGTVNITIGDQAVAVLGTVNLT